MKKYFFYVGLLLTCFINIDPCRSGEGVIESSVGNVLTSLPPEILDHVTEYFDSPTRLRVSRVNKEMNGTIRSGDEKFYKQSDKQFEEIKENFQKLKQLHGYLFNVFIDMPPENLFFKRFHTFMYKLSMHNLEKRWSRCFKEHSSQDKDYIRKVRSIEMSKKEWRGLVSNISKSTKFYSDWVKKIEEVRNKANTDNPD